MANVYYQNPFNPHYELSTDSRTIGQQQTYSPLIYTKLWDTLPSNFIFVNTVSTSNITYSNIKYLIYHIDGNYNDCRTFCVPKSDQTPNFSYGTNTTTLFLEQENSFTSIFNDITIFLYQSSSDPHVLIYPQNNTTLIDNTFNLQCDIGIFRDDNDNIIGLGYKIGQSDSNPEDLLQSRIINNILVTDFNISNQYSNNLYITPTITFKHAKYTYLTQFTATDINAAPANHTHTWADLYGCLSLAQGGTGRTDLVDNAVIYKDGSKFKGLTVSEGVFAKNISTGELSWQPHLPLASGGTGKTSRDACTSTLIQSHMVPSITPTFSVNLNSTKWVGRLYNAKTGFRVLIPLGGFSWAEGYNITFSGTLRIRQMNAGWSGGSGYLFGSDANTAVPISNISGGSNNFTSSVGIRQFPFMGCVEIYGDSGIAQGKAIGMGPIVTEWATLTINFTAA